MAESERRHCVENLKSQHGSTAAVREMISAAHISGTIDSRYELTTPRKLRQLGLCDNALRGSWQGLHQEDRKSVV